MLGTTPEGDAYTFNEYRAMLQEAGFHGRNCILCPNRPKCDHGHGQGPGVPGHSVFPVIWGMFNNVLAKGDGHCLLRDADTPRSTSPCSVGSVARMPLGVRCVAPGQE
ncbi:MAG: hypothetical protein R3F31_20045 [Verrucomicrobiales bacterium]